MKDEEGVESGGVAGEVKVKKGVVPARVEKGVGPKGVAEGAVTEKGVESGGVAEMELVRLELEARHQQELKNAVMAARKVGACC